ncbi:MAG: hypothetical protein ACI82F_004487, partial [Planctomycetota bacterium]
MLPRLMPHHFDTDPALLWPPDGFSIEPRPFASSPLKNSSFSVGLHKLPGKASGSPRSCTYTGGSDNA